MSSQRTSALLLLCAALAACGGSTEEPADDARHELGPEIGQAAEEGGFLDLFVDKFIVLRGLDRAEYAYRLREPVFVPHAAEQVRQARLLRLLVVEQQVVLGNSLAKLDDFRIEDAWPFLLIGVLVPGISQVMFVRAIRDIGASRAQGHPDADLMRPPADGIRDDAVNSDRRYDKRHRPEEP